MGKISSPLWLADSTKLALLMILIVFAFIFGGSSRYDAASLLILRPASVCIAAYALYLFQMDKNRLNAPIVLLLMLLAYITIQIIPLPPVIWQELPGRGLIFKIDEAIGLSDAWRPITMSPSRTLNSLFSLFVPLAILLLMAKIDQKSADKVLYLIIALCIFGLILSIAQLLGPNKGPLYLYKVTNFGLPVGWFANRNHNAILFASIIPIIAYFVTFSKRIKIGVVAKAGLITFSTVLLVLMVLMTGSRAGSILVVVPVAIIVVLVARSINYSSSGKRRGDPVLVSFLRRHAVAVALIILLIVVVAVLNLSESEAILRFADNDPDSEVRLKTLPYLQDMAQAYMPFGSGFGTFELVYKIIEPDFFLSPNYLNQAHNDPLQIIIEGGLFALVILTVFLAWLANALRLVIPQLWHGVQGQHCPASTWQHASSLLAICIVLLGSIADYPARTPLIMAYMSVLLALAIRTQPEKKSTRRK